MLDVVPTSGSDCEVIIYLYLKYGIEQTLQMLDGVFAFCLLDTRKNNLYVARDPFGVRPMFMLNRNNEYYGFASEIKSLIGYQTLDHKVEIVPFQPGTYSLFTRSTLEWQPVLQNSRWHTIAFSSNDSIFSIDVLREALIQSVKKRCNTTERPIACLLSGGLDSSLITALVKQHVKGILETYSIGMEGSVDLKHARIVADYLETKHTEIVLTEDDFFNAIPEVIQAIESFDVTTIRASIGNYLIGKYIAQHSEAKVIFNGDGADEICGGYLYMHSCPDPIEYDRETRRLIKDIHLFDVLRSDRCISSHGLEPRTPFLDRNFVNTYLSISPNIRFSSQTKMTKYLLRKAFTNKDSPILPDCILWRTKEAFSDGVSRQTRSLYNIIRERVSAELDEKTYYKNIFLQYYPLSEENCKKVTPYYWMPKYVDAIDASARTLELYTEKMNTVHDLL